ncbi:MAG TPA: class E sortase [Patescibacteria group bacterium]|nr:class E sortase [Patescibacteria group bacterium]
MKLSRVNTSLFIAILVINLYIILAPVTPMLTFWLSRHTSGSYSQLTSQLGNSPASIKTTPKDNRLVIPAMLLDQPINEGKDISAARTQPWRRPNTSTPDKGGNTVIVAHRYTYTSPKGSFYYLDKLKLNDEIGVFWQGKRYLYKVINVKVVAPTDTSIENQTQDSRLTLYTCTPLWLPKDRLVVTSELESQP